MRHQGRLGGSSPGHASAIGTEESYRPGCFLTPGSPFSSGERAWPRLLAIALERRTWKCWPCNLGGDAAELVKLKNGVAFPEAVRIVAELSGIVTPSGRSPPTATPRPATAPTRQQARQGRQPAARAIVRLAPGRCPGPRDRGRRPPLDARGDRGPGLSPRPRSDR